MQKDEGKLASPLWEGGPKGNNNERQQIIPLREIVTNESMDVAYNLTDLMESDVKKRSSIDRMTPYRIEWVKEQIKRCRKQALPDPCLEVECWTQGKNPYTRISLKEHLEKTEQE